MLETIQKLLPWASGLPIVPKVVLTAVWVLLSFLLLYLVWVPAPQQQVENMPGVQQSYDRMVRQLIRIKRLPSGQVLVDGQPVETRLVDYYSKYAAIADYVAHHPRDIKGAYEEVWAQGGGSRVIINETETFEAVVSGFFDEYSFTKAAK